MNYRKRDIVLDKIRKYCSGNNCDAGYYHECIKIITDFKDIEAMNEIVDCLDMLFNDSKLRGSPDNVSF